MWCALNRDFLTPLVYVIIEGLYISGNRTLILTREMIQGRFAYIWLDTPENFLMPLAQPEQESQMKSQEQ